MRKPLFTLLILAASFFYSAQSAEKLSEQKNDITNEHKNQVYVEVIDKIEKIKCGVCDGGTIICKDCNGTGEGNESECPICGGTCKRTTYTKSKKSTKDQMMVFRCSKCRKDFQDWATCRACGGRGELKCKYFGGYGFIINKISHWGWIKVKEPVGTKGAKDGVKK